MVWRRKDVATYKTGSLFDKVIVLVLISIA